MRGVTRGLFERQGDQGADDDEAGLETLQIGTVSETLRIYGGYYRHPRDVSEVIEVGDSDYFVLMPGETCHGLTRERIRLPNDLCGWLQGRSRFARLGLMVHITAAFIQPGVDNHQALEINNAGPMPLALRPGIALCQFIFETCIGQASYEGRYRSQIAP